MKYSVSIILVVGIVGAALIGGCAHNDGSDLPAIDGGSDAGPTPSDGGPRDDDGDGYRAGVDCNDADPAIHPGAVEVCDGIDQDCDGTPDNGLSMTVYDDMDGDTFGDPDSAHDNCELGDDEVDRAGDCDDTHADVNPDATEICDTIDNDCDGDTDEEGTSTYYRDSDGDGFGDADMTIEACSMPSGFAVDSTDCDDDEPTVHPGGTEICDGLDNDCNSNVDDGVMDRYFVDRDGDGFGVDSAGTNRLGCILPMGYSATAGDCDDTNPTAFPDAVEICDGADNNCDTRVDEGGLTRYYPDADGDGYGVETGAVDACTRPAGTAPYAGDCDDGNAAINPGAAESCNMIDDDCDMRADEGVRVRVFRDEDGDGYGNPMMSAQRCSDGGGYVFDNTDCDDSRAAANPDATEICDTIDNDCDTDIDEGVTVPVYDDGDGDGFGDVFLRNGCAPGMNESANDEDCNDGDASIFPGAIDRPGDGIDQDCDGIDPMLPIGHVCYGDDTVLSLGRLHEGSLRISDQAGGPRGSSYRFDDLEIVLTAGQQYTFSVWSEQFDTYVYVLDQTCAVVASNDDGGAGRSSALEFTPTADGVYTLIVTSFSSSGVGAYRAKVYPGSGGRQCLQNNEVIGVGEDHRFSLDSTTTTAGPRGAGYRYRDWGIFMDAGETITLQAIADTFDSYLAILDPGCNVAVSGAGVSYTPNTRLTYTAPAAGIYTIAAGANVLGASGTMDLEVVRGSLGNNCFFDPAQATLPREYTTAALTEYDESSGGPLGAGHHWDDYEIVGGPLRGVAAHPAVIELDVDLAAFDESCAPMTGTTPEDMHMSSMDRGLSVRPADWAQIITFAVSATSPGALGRTLLTFAPMDGWSGCGGDGRGITRRETVHDRIEATDAGGGPVVGNRYDDYEIYLEAGTNVSFVADSNTFDPAIAILAPDSCAMLTSNRDGAAGDGAYLNFTASSTGIYTVVVESETADGVGEYWLQASPSELDSGCYGDSEGISVADGRYDGYLTSSIDESGQRTIFGTHYHDDIEIYVLSGQTVQIDHSASWDTYLYLLAPDCSAAAFDDDGGPGLNSRITFTAATSGVYTIIPTSFSANVTGSYTVSTTAVNEF